MNFSISIGTKKMTFRLEILVLIVFVAWLLFGHLICSCSKIGIKEGFNMASSTISNVREGFSANNIAYTSEFGKFKKNDTTIMNPKNWSMPTLLYTPGKTPDKGVQSIWGRTPQPIPLRKGEMNMFATTPFKPECCPNTYSTSTGCACMTVDQYDYLRGRGSNNVPYSEY
jgi:hypothetical protein